MGVVGNPAGHGLHGGVQAPGFQAGQPVGQQQRIDAAGGGGDIGGVFGGGQQQCTHGLAQGCAPGGIGRGHQVMHKAADFGRQARNVQHLAEGWAHGLAVGCCANSTLDAPGQEKLQKAAVRKAVQPVGRARQEGCGAQLHVQLVGVELAAPVHTLFHQAEQVAVVDAVAHALPQQQGQFFQHGAQHGAGALALDGLELFQPLVGVGLVQHAGAQGLAAAGLPLFQAGQAGNDDVEQLRAVAQLQHALLAQKGQGFGAFGFAQAQHQKLAHLLGGEGGHGVDGTVKPLGHVLQGRGGNAVLLASGGFDGIAVVFEKLLAAGDEHAVALRRVARVGGDAHQHAELLHHAAPDGGDAHFVKRIEDEHDAPALHQVQQHAGVFALAGGLQPALGQQFFQPHFVGEIAQAHAQGHGGQAVFAGAFGQLVAELFSEGGFAGAVVAQQHPQAAVAATGPLDAVGHQIGDGGFG